MLQLWSLAGRWGLQAPNVSKRSICCQKTCENGHAKSCAQMGLITLGQASNQNGCDSVNDFYQRACDLGSTEDVSVGLNTLNREIGTNINLTQAAQFYEKSCNNLHAESCDKLGILYSEGRGVASDVEKALVFV